MKFTRRNLLQRIGAVGGAGAAFAAMEALGLAAITPAKAENFTLPPRSGNGRSVVVLGAGIAGLVAAYELRQAGYRVTVLEANDRIGGRSWTIRGQDRVAMHDRPPQRANFSDGLYFNAGPARLPPSHRVILGYAKRLGVALEPFVNNNDSAKWDFGGKVHAQREMRYALDSRIGELLSKAINRKALDDAMTADEMANFRQFLGAWAGLQRDGAAGPDQALGFRTAPGGYQHPYEAAMPLTLKELLPSPAIGLPYLFERVNDMQPAMLQPVGGMDRIAHALYDQVRGDVRLGQPVTAIRRSGDGVRIEHGKSATNADYCVCALPAHLLSRIPNDFSAAKQTALKDIVYLKSVKVAFESPRFWEDEGIYGGLGWTDRLNENILYPSSGFHSGRGVLVAAYCAGWTHQENPDKFASLPLAEQIAISRASVEAMHPGQSGRMTSPVAVDWGQVAWSEGVGAIAPDWGDERRGPRYEELLKPEGPIVFAGEHLSYVGLWQEGAALSAHEALALVSAMAGSRAGTAAAA